MIVHIGQFLLAGLFSDVEGGSVFFNLQSVLNGILTDEGKDTNSGAKRRLRTTFSRKAIDAPRDGEQAAKKSGIERAW